MTAFQKLHDYYKTHDAIAAAFKMERTNVTAWKKNGIPAKRAIEVERRTKGAVTAMDVLRG